MSRIYLLDTNIIGHWARKTGEACRPFLKASPFTPTERREEEAERERLQRHQALRTSFSMHQGEPRQVIQELRLKMPLADLQALPEEHRSQELSRRLDAEAVRPFDLSRGQLLRTLLLRLDEEDHVLAATMHHIERLSESYLGVFAQVVQAPQIRLGEVEPRTPAERSEKESQQKRHGKSRLKSLLDIQSRD